MRDSEALGVRGINSKRGKGNLHFAFLFEGRVLRVPAGFLAAVVNGSTECTTFVMLPNISKPAVFTELDEDNRDRIVSAIQAAESLMQSSQQVLAWR